MKKILHISLIILALSSLPSCRREHALHWYKGNLHTHTTISDGDSSPESVIRWYKDHGYNFLAITDHERATDFPLFETRSAGFRPGPPEGLFPLTERGMIQLFSN